MKFKIVELEDVHHCTWALMTYDVLAKSESFDTFWFYCQLSGVIFNLKYLLDGCSKGSSIPQSRKKKNIIGNKSSDFTKSNMMCYLYNMF